MTHSFRYRQELFIGVLVLISGFIYPIRSVQAQQTSNQSTVQNSAAPSASSVTTGGTNVNYQSNNAYDNLLGFGGGISCRTPTLYMGGNVGKVDAYQIDPLQRLHNQNNNYQFNAGVLVPFGSKINDYCKTIAEKIAGDRKIASDLSMIKACDELLKKNIRVDPKRFPHIAVCEDYRVMMQDIAKTTPSSPSPKKEKSVNLPAIKPVTDRAL